MKQDGQLGKLVKVDFKDKKTVQTKTRTKGMYTVHIEQT